MAKKPSPAVRIVVPLVLLAVGVGIFFAVLTNTQNQNARRQAAQNPPDATTPDNPAPDAPQPVDDAQPGTQADSDADAAQQGAPADDTDTDSDPADVAQPEPADPAPALADATGWRPLEVAQPDVEPASLGSLEPESGHVIEVRFTRNGAGIQSIRLTNHFQTIEGVEQEFVQEASVIPVGTSSLLASPFALERLMVGPNAQELTPMALGFGPYWEETSPGAFQATIVDADETPVARVTRRYEVVAGSHDVTIRQDVENLTESPLVVRWDFNGPIELDQLATSYGQDKRRSRFGYLLPERLYAGGAPTALSRAYLTSRSDTIPSKAGETRELWPNSRSVKSEYSLSWTALTNRYFAVAVHPALARNAPEGAPIDPAFSEIESVNSFALRPKKNTDDGPGLILQLTSETRTVAPGGSGQLDIAFYAGPLSKKLIRDEAGADVLGLDGLVVFNFGGPCSFCTFTWLTSPIHAFLNLIHDYVVFDWALAIVLLVLAVRTILHPITKYSQTNMQRFAKQMQALAPKQKKLQEKYKDDPQRMRVEMQRLMKEENVNFAGALGCLPMFLQSPIWIALYATLYFAFELRHDAAFFGVFHSINNWAFLADLGEPDRFIDFGRAIFTVPLLGEIRSINILPFLLGAVFFVHQKYLTPPPTATMTPEQEAQQKLIRVMMVGLFPIFLYNAPSGLALYFITNSALGIIESRHIRAHVDKLEAEGRLHKKREPRKKKPGGKPGVLERIQAELERKANEQQRARGQGRSSSKGSGRRR